MTSSDVGCAREGVRYVRNPPSPCVYVVGEPLPQFQKESLMGCAWSNVSCKGESDEQCARARKEHVYLFFPPRDGHLCACMSTYGRRKMGHGRSGPPLSLSLLRMCGEGKGVELEGEGGCAYPSTRGERGCCHVDECVHLTRERWR